MKKFAALILVLVVSVIALTACNMMPTAPVATEAPAATEVPTQTPTEMPTEIPAEVTEVPAEATEAPTEAPAA